ncbi:MAG: HtrA protease/chaperone protein [uncultured Solirubrobacteraceae bacterium]|uniref:HtrA protease/chaperone protein n=1 Tax=uncultured Solirubrobacteraceae bacterium TaxID=1162706 RepID=A0A6J4RSI1_9ACTN|nr:MAG: HtrA protease/chaperone protein [uncultured Solirubrobacteraceae bacterium]
MSRLSPGTMLAFAIGVLTSAIALVVLLLATGEIGGDDPAPAPAAATPAPDSPAVPRTAPVSVADIYARVSSGVVFIAARGADDGVPAPGGGQAATGSGFLIDSEGSIVTNDHVVAASGSVTVRFGDGDAVPARLRGRDPSSDLALLQVDPADIPSGVRPVELATSEGLRAGDAAIAIGSPFGLAGTVTTGIISALDREIPAPNGFTISGVLQTDAAINPGNSGGPLLDARGRAIGVNSQIATGGGNQSSGVGFAVPIDTVREVVPELKEGGVVERAWLGVTTADDPGGAGAVIRGVVAGGPADRAGLRPGDVIIGIAGDAVRDPGDVGTQVNARDPGEEVQVRVRRDDEETDVVVRLGERPQANPSG